MRCVALAVLTAASGCLLTPVRRSAFVPRNTVPANHGAPIGDSGFKGFAQLNSVRLTPTEPKTIEEILASLPEEGAAGLWIPRLQLGAGLYGAANEYFTVGGQFGYTRLEWAYSNVLGVLPFPEGMDDQQIFLGGPGARLNLPIALEDGRRILTPALLVEANIATIPQAVWVLPDGAVAVDPETGELDIAQYEFVRIDRDWFLLPTIAAHITVSPLEYLHVVGMVGLERNVKNIGFDPDIENLDESTLQPYFHGFAGLGLEGRYAPLFGTIVLNGAFGQPREIRFGLSLTASLGVVFE